MSVSAWRYRRNCLVTGHTPAAHSSPMAGESSGMPFACTHAATQRGAMAAKSLMSSSTMAMRWWTERATHASLCACSVCTAASISSRVDGKMLPETEGNWGEPWWMSMVMACASVYREVSTLQCAMAILLEAEGDYKPVRAYLSPRQGSIKAHPSTPPSARPYGLDG